MGGQEGGGATTSGDIQRNMSVPLMLDYLGIRLDSAAAQDVNGKINLVVTDLEEQYVLTLRSGVLLYQQGVQDPEAGATWQMPKAALFALLQGNAGGVRQMAQIQGDQSLLDQLCQHVTIFNGFFNIIEP